MWQVNREQLRKHQSCDKNGIFIFLKNLQFQNCFHAHQEANPITSKFSMKEDSNRNKPKYRLRPATDRFYFDKNQNASFGYNCPLV